MQYKLDELKSSVVMMIEKFASNRTYANVTKDSSSLQIVESTSSENLQNLSGSSNVDEGYGDRSEFNVHSSSSETQVKTLFVPDTRLNERGFFRITTPQPVPVRITQRNQLPNARKQTPVLHRAVKNSPRTLKTLIVGDSVHKRIEK